MFVGKFSVRDLQIQHDLARTRMTSRQVAWGSCTAVANASIGVGLGCLGKKVSFI